MRAALWNDLMGEAELSSQEVENSAEEANRAAAQNSTDDGLRFLFFPDDEPLGFPFDDEFEGLFDFGGSTAGNTPAGPPLSPPSPVIAGGGRGTGRANARERKRKPPANAANAANAQAKGDATAKRAKHMGCTCKAKGKKNGGCLRLYCDCYAMGAACVPGVCTCVGCENTTDGPRRKKVKPCTCKRNKCLKKYCECFARGDACMRGCTCTDCHNRPDGSALDVAPGVVAPRAAAPVANV